MHNSNIPTDRELPPTAKLIKSTILAIIVAAVLLVTVVMPAEYAIDPTGLGELTGLQRMGEIKVSLAKEAAEADALLLVEEDAPSEVVEEAVPESVLPAIPAIPATQNHEMTFTLAPDEGTEVKVTMIKGATVDYVWETDGGRANFDMHADSKELKIDYHSYSKGSEQKSDGTLEAAFNGNHGWFWRNRTKEPLTITIKTSGEYSAIERF